MTRPPRSVAPPTHRPALQPPLTPLDQLFAGTHQFLTHHAATAPEPTSSTPGSSRHCLTGALHRGEFEVHYQPIVASDTGQVVKVEALLRWRPAAGPLVSPDDFLALLDATGELADVGAWVLREACRAAVHWPGIRVAVNLSGAQFLTGRFVSTVQQALRDSGLPAGMLELELTEGMLLTPACSTTRALRHLKDRGVRVILDDFGTGYANLSCLQAFEFDGLKLDRSLIRPLQQNDVRSLTIVQSLADLCRHLHLELTAEGVETHRQQQVLQSLNVPLMQGYLFARPHPHWIQAVDRIRARTVTVPDEKAEATLP